MNATETAYIAWDYEWRTLEGRGAWCIPEREVEDMVPILKRAGAEKVLDLGCGIGRHSFLLAHEGFSVYALDASDHGIAFLENEALKSGLKVETAVAKMTDLPYPNAWFDFVLAWNVIYHGDHSVVMKTVSEITRVLRAGGFFLGTMLSGRNSEIGKGTRISCNTYVTPSGADKGHPHFYCDFRELTGLFPRYEIWSAKDVEHGTPGSFHWHLCARKRS
jgi:tellurite methyltransferase